MPWLLRSIENLHGRFVFGRRVQVLARTLAACLPAGVSVLDVGCGDGTIGHLLRQHDPTLVVQGLEVSPRPRCRIECKLFDGQRIPHDDNSFDVCLFVDVLHHTRDMEALLKEGRRVCRQFVLIKDHLCENRFDWWTLKWMDWVGNRPHGVVLTYNYKSRKQWADSFVSCGLQKSTWQEDIPLYPAPLSAIFGRGLHYVALLKKVP